MIDTTRSRLPNPASQRGDTLIEVVISAMLLAVIVVGTLTGLNSANRATSQQRARSQADVLAQEEEEQFRSQPIAKLSELSITHEAVVHEVDASGTKYLISSTAQYKNDATATSSCSASTPEANYIQTSSVVTWEPLGSGRVVETSLVSPPPSAAIIARITNAAGEPVPGMNVEAVGATTLTGYTSTDGCAILAVLPGEYKLNAFKAGYVDENGYSDSIEDPVTNSPFYVVAEATVKVPLEFDKAGTLEATFEKPLTSEATEGDSFVIANNGMNPAFASFPKTGVGTYTAKLSTGAHVFPFSERYSVYAGTCEADNPHVVNSANPAPQTISVVGGQVASVALPVPLVSIQVMSGNPIIPGNTVTTASGIITDKGCHTTRTFTETPGGALPHPALPFGTYELCVQYGGKFWKDNEFTNSTTAGPAGNWTGEGMVGSVARIYMNGLHAESGSCP